MKKKQFFCEELKEEIKEILTYAEQSLEVSE